ncbi:MAG: VWA domain-containing protein [Clostridiales bacterium]|nr:VWA domain-containing protein [Clostridiales bacterium]
MRNYSKNKQVKRILAGILTIIMVFVSIDLSQFVSVEAATEYDTLYLIDNTAEKWVKNDNAKIKAINNSNGHTAYWMTQKDETTWSVKVPKSAYNITFNRYAEDKTTQWNSWSAGGRDKNNAYYVDGTEYGHWGIMEESEEYFHAGDIIYLDVSEFTQWENDDAVMYVNFTNASKQENGGNDIIISKVDKTLYSPVTGLAELEDNIYLYQIKENDEGASSLRFWRGSTTTLWNCSVELTYKEYKKGKNCVKIARWTENGSITTKETDLNKDTDEDELSDIYEAIIGTDRKNPDTDGDGLKDGDEIYILGTDPLVADSDNNGIPDDKEDFDNDGLTNLEEIRLETNPISIDTDNDSLTDGDEVSVYFTNPLLVDTDGDGLSDGDEIALGFDPLRVDTNDNGIPDGKEKTLQTLEIEVKEEEKPEITGVSVKMKGTGYLQSNTTIESVYGEDMLSSDVVGLIGVPVEITSDSSFDQATITFSYEKSLLGETKEEDLAIMWYDEENNIYKILDEDTVIDTKKQTVSYTTTHFSTYLVVDRQKWYDVWSKYVTYYRNPPSCSMPVDYFDVCYVVDTSGSMSGTRIQTAIEAIGSFNNALYNNDRAAIVGFDSSATTYSGFTSDQTALENALRSLHANGNTNVNAGLIQAMDLYDSDTSYNKKIIILLCDGDVNYTDATLQRAIKNKIKIFPVLIGSTYGEEALQELAGQTGGTFYYANTAEDVRKALFGIQDETIDEVDTTDTDKDGLYDIYEIGGMIIPNGQYLYSDPLLADTDNDGLTDAEEMGNLGNYADQPVMKQFSMKLQGFDAELYIKFFDYRCDPNKTDTDGDGYEDKKDPNPNSNDVHVIALSDADNFVTIVDDEEVGKLHYGGHQGWFGSNVARNGACGTVAAANIMAYMSTKNSKFSDLYGYDSFTKSNYLSYMNEVYEYLSPGYIPCTEIPTGIWSIYSVGNAVEKFGDKHGVDIHPIYDSSWFTKENTMNYIASGLNSDAPVAMLIGMNSHLRNIEVKHLYNDSYMQSTFEYHWVTITKMRIDDISKKTTVKVSTWGGYSYLDFDDFLKSKITKALLYFK